MNPCGRQYAGPQPVGVAYHPVEDIVYFPWTTTTEVRAFDTNTFAQIGTYNFEDTFTGNGNHAFQQGRLKVSRDGSLLFSTVTGGVRFVRLYAPLNAEGGEIFTNEDSPVFFNLLGGVGNGGAVSYRIETPPVHGTLSGTGRDLTYTPGPDFNGTDIFRLRPGRVRPGDRPHQRRPGQRRAHGGGQVPGDGRGRGRVNHPLRRGR